MTQILERSSARMCQMPTHCLLVVGSSLGLCPGYPSDLLHLMDLHQNLKIQTG